MGNRKKTKAKSVPDRVDYLLELLGRLHRVIDARLGKTTGPLATKLTLGQVRTLFYLMEQGPATMRAAAQNSGVAMSTMSDMANRLVKLGVVKRIRDPHDRRIVRLEITRAGVKGFEDKAKMMRKSIVDLLVKYSEREQLQLVAALKTVETILIKQEV